METLSNTDFDRLEKLLRTKRLEELSTTEKQWIHTVISEEEYASMSGLYLMLNNSTQSLDLEPQPAIKSRLDGAWSAKYKHPGIFQIKLPAYQTVAAAMIFFLIGFAINWNRPVQPKIIRETVQVIKYISQPESTKVKQHEAPQLEQRKVIQPTQPEPVQPIRDEVEHGLPELNPEFTRQQEITMANITHAMNEKVGSSIGSDTVLQKMLVRVY